MISLEIMLFCNAHPSVFFCFRDRFRVALSLTSPLKSLGLFSFLFVCDYSCVVSVLLVSSARLPVASVTTRIRGRAECGSICSTRIIVFYYCVVYTVFVEACF